MVLKHLTPSFDFVNKTEPLIGDQMNTKKLISVAILAGTALASAAASGTITLENRTDFLLETYDGITVPSKVKGALATDSIGKSANFGFNINRIRVKFAGQFSNDVKYGLRLRFDKGFGPVLSDPTSTTTTTTTTTLSGTPATAKSTSKSVTTTTAGSAKKIGGISLLDAALDQAYVQPKLTDDLSMKIGRFGVDGLGFEEAVFSSADVFQMSIIDKNYSTTGVGARLVNKLTGIGEVTATVLNSDVAYTDDRAGQKFLTYGAGFTGKLGMIEPIANLYMYPKTSWTEGKIEAGAGARVTLDKFITVLDFQSQIMNGTDKVTGAANMLSTKSGATIDHVTNIDKVLDASIFIQYKADMFRPQAKFHYDMGYLGKDEVGKVMSGSAGCEIFPDKDAKYRYHVMVADMITTPHDVVSDKDLSTTHQMKLYVGVNASLDMWKF